MLLELGVRGDAGLACACGAESTPETGSADVGGVVVDVDGADGELLAQVDRSYGVHCHDASVWVDRRETVGDAGVAELRGLDEETVDVDPFWERGGIGEVGDEGVSGAVPATGNVVALSRPIKLSKAAVQNPLLFFRMSFFGERHELWHDFSLHFGEDGGRGGPGWVQAQELVLVFSGERIEGTHQTIHLIPGGGQADERRLTDDPGASSDHLRRVDAVFARARHMLDLEVGEDGHQLSHCRCHTDACTREI